jgi:hypothetical protein
MKWPVGWPHEELSNVWSLPLMTHSSKLDTQRQEWLDQPWQVGVLDVVAMYSFDLKPWPLFLITPS